MNFDRSTAISLEDICRRNLKGTVLDIFYIIMLNNNISKKEIIQHFLNYDTDTTAKATKYRLLVDVGIAKLEGAMLIECWREGKNHPYTLTAYGHEAKEIMRNLFEEDSSMCYGSKVMVHAT
ncbi:hypothetical protein [Paenibacillus agilis]|uniref:Transcription regulator PadR N-terminal domain-containing protein n=1 Tax=Paenibacillus agilis TaxID=3020863 RepID=A0A559IDA7_9BACL|nr:hypothetical protein [Paenibacillus agilis]TVX85635.1 hypothetical protein FPZ44_25115 [Paenibacillus agilis]